MTCNASGYFNIISHCNKHSSAQVQHLNISKRARIESILKLHSAQPVADEYIVKKKRSIRKTEPSKLGKIPQFARVVHTLYEIIHELQINKHDINRRKMKQSIEQN